MISDAINICASSIARCAQWFTEIIDSVSAGEFYVAMVFIVLSCGFLLSNFGAVRGAGSDLADREAAYWKNYKPKAPVYPTRHKRLGGSKSLTYRG